MTAATLPTQLWLAYWRYRRIYHRYSVDGLEHLLAGSRPSLIVGYHGRGLADDLCILGLTLYERLGYLPPTLVHRGVEVIPPLKWLSDGLGFVTSDSAALAAAVAKGQHVITAPGGVTESCRSFRDRYRVAWGEHVGYLRLALKYGLRIVPVASAGVDDSYIGLNDGPVLGRRLGLPREWAWPLWIAVGPLGFWPFSPPFPTRIRQLIGEPIDLGANGATALNDREHLLALHRQVTARVQALLDEARGTSRSRTSVAQGRDGQIQTAQRRKAMGFNEMLTRKQIETLHDAYKTSGMTEQLKATFRDMYAATSGYIDAIGKVFFELPEDVREQPPDVVSAANRERCLLALLAARGGGFTLATHIYLALMEGIRRPGQPDDISPEEIANIIFLAGVYTGADNLMLSLATLMKTLPILADIADTQPKKDQSAVFQVLKEKYGLAPPPKQPGPPPTPPGPASRS